MLVKGAPGSKSLGVRYWFLFGSSTYPRHCLFVKVIFNSVLYDWLYSFISSFLTKHHKIQQNFNKNNHDHIKHDTDTYVDVNITWTLCWNVLYTVSPISSKIIPYEGGKSQFMALLRRTYLPKLSWLLQMSWCQSRTSPSATIMLILIWLQVIILTYVS